jgi:tRNA-splicing ligase RtcB
MFFSQIIFIASNCFILKFRLKMPRTYEEELKFFERRTPSMIQIKKGFVPNMNVGGRFYVNDKLESLVYEELKTNCEHGGIGGFIPAVKQIANAACLPGIVGVCLVNFSVLRLLF